MMEDNIDANAPLDCAEFHLFPSKNRYKPCVYSGNQVELLRSGSLDELVQHVPDLRDWSSGESNAYFKLEPPKNVDSCTWFTKSTLTRFLNIAGTPNILSTTNAIKSEISQLEEARKFHVSLYAKGETEIVSSDASKNELLQAMDLRLTALRQKLADTFNRAAGVACSSTDIADVERISHLFRALDIRDILHKLELSQTDQVVDLRNDKISFSTDDSPNDKVNTIEHNIQVSKLSNSDTPVKYGVSPAKAAQVERQSSTESEESSDSSVEDQPSAERSRSLIRSASPRRSASPMRRIQIGRSRSRRSTALTIKSLSYFPSRDRIMSHRDTAANSSDEEESQQPPKKPDSNVQRMSVQDAINLFESKQRDQSLDIQKRRSTFDGSFSAHKSVLRRWSAGMGGSSPQHQQEVAPKNSVTMTPDNPQGGVISEKLVEQRTDSDLLPGGEDSIETAEVDMTLAPAQKRTSYPIAEVDTPATQVEENTEKFMASAEWNKQKEMELNQMLMKMMESKPRRYKNATPDNSSSPAVPQERKGGFYDHYKEKRDEKLRGETAGKRAEKAAQFKAMQHALEERKAKMGFTHKSDAERKHSLTVSQRSLKTSSQSALQKDSSKSALGKKASSKLSPSSAVRKSWPSTPSPSAAGVSPAKTPGGTTPTRRKPQSVPSVPRSNPRVEATPPRAKNVKASQAETSKGMNIVNEKQQQKLTNSGKTAKTNVQTSGNDCSIVSRKPSLYSKVTKKSSVVPVESKPFLRKGSRVGPGASPIVKLKAASPPEKITKNSGNPTPAQEKEEVNNNSEFISQQEERDLKAPDPQADSELQTQVPNQEKYADITNLEEVTNSDEREAQSELKTEAEVESEISPTAWIEIEEHPDEPILCDNSPYHIASPATVAPVTMSPRVRHSLSQMLLEESAESDVIEWGNSENPSAIIYQKDAPKGLKRLLKFARKSRADPNLTGWPSPSAFSEGEDDSEESKAFNKKNADYLQRNAAFHLKDPGPQRTTLGKVQANGSRFSTQNDSQRLQDHISIAANTSKATRSFFSLSAFRGSKPNDGKLR